VAPISPRALRRAPWRPERWLLLAPLASPGATAKPWQDACAGTGAALEQSSAYGAWLLSGAAAAETLRRGCRLDLERLAPGRAAATQMAQVAVILARLPAGLLLLSPASTAQHLSEWLAAAAAPFGFVSGADVTVRALSGDEAL
jgi:heterotetrameric sarcosine oxidase gamma subunit